MIRFTDTPQAFDLTNDILANNGWPRLYGGAFWKFRFQIQDTAGAGRDLTSALVIFKLVYEEASLTRKTGVASSGAPTNQIVLDDQTTEDTEAGTGKGWLSVYCYAIAAEVAEFAAFFTDIGEEGFVRGRYELAVKFGDGDTQHPMFAGRIDINQPQNTFPLS